MRPPDSRRLRAMRSGLRRSRRDDSGFTLIEMMVALVVVMIVMLAVVGGIVESQKAQRVAESRNAAVQVAQNLLQNAIVGGWDSTGFYGDDANITPGPNGEPTVLLDTTAPDLRPSNVPYPNSDDDPNAPVVVGTHSFSYVITISWAKDPGLGTTSIAADQNDPNNTDGTYTYKRVVVTVNYQVNGSPESLTQETLLAPTDSDQDVPGANTTDQTCDSTLTNPTIFCGVSVANGYITTNPSAMAQTLTTPVEFTATLQPGVTATSVTVTYLDGTTSTSTVTKAMSLDSTSTWYQYTIPVGGHVHNVTTNVQFKAVVGGISYTETVSVDWWHG